MTKTMVTKRRRSYKKNTSLKQKILKLSEAKHLTASKQYVGLKRNEYLTMNLTSQIGQGTAINQRIGDEIYLEALKFRATLETDIAATAYVLRIIVGYSDAEYGSSTWTTSGLGSAIFHNGTGVTTLTTNGLVNAKNFTTVYDETTTINSQIAGSASADVLAATVPLKSKFPYRVAGGVYGKTKNLYMFACGYIVNGAVAATVGTLTVDFDLIFKE